ncbi:MAG TPA: phosphate ABC transporter substrate-binding protein [Thermoanaerobaculia bacterium]|nr:phosphate ABC transporter substrate-binding protein [Thermoanaerobaculia bacterium]
MTSFDPTRLRPLPLALSLTPPLALPLALLLALGACGRDDGARSPAAEEAGPAAGRVTPAAGEEGAADGEQEAPAGAFALDPELAPYQTTSGVAGTLGSVGSDTLNNLMTLWAEGFNALYPNVRVQIEGKGSSTAPPALIAGTAQLGPMSRPMKAQERDDFDKRYGYAPTEVRVALDALAVYVHRDNPLSRLTLPQVDAIFSKTRACGYPGDVSTWRAAGVEGPLSGRQISLYGRNSASGTYGFFKDHALCGGDYKDAVKEQPGSASVVQGVAEDGSAIGYSGIGYRTSGVKAVKLAADDAAPAYGVSQEEVYSGDYPLARYLYVYVNKPPNEPLDPLVRELLAYVLSRQGQEAVIKDGYVPLTAQVAEQQRAALR